jgi:hypothetical protein
METEIKITIDLYSRGRNIKFPKNYIYLEKSKRLIIYKIEGAVDMIEIYGTYFCAAETATYRKT